MKSEIESILLANLYLVKCKFDCKKNGESANIARKFLTQKIKKVLLQRNKTLDKQD